MDIAVTGASGLIGKALVRRLVADGHGVRRLVRRPPAGPDEVTWAPAAGTIDTEGLAGVGAVVHLAGEGIATRRWSDAQKRRIRESRTAGTGLVARTVATLDPRPVLLCGSAIGIYGDRGDEELTEDSPAGGGFLAGVVQDWEAAAAPAVAAGVRTTFLRTGIVLSAEGGALQRQLPIFRLGLGGRFGRGRQWQPWVSLDDEVGAIVHLLGADVEGPVNLVAPHPVTNAELTKALGRALRRPTVVPIPGFGPKLLYGSELVDEVLLSSARVVPARLRASGYHFRHATIDDALGALLGYPH